MAVRCPFCGDKVETGGPGTGEQVPCPTCHAMVDIRLAAPFTPDSPPDPTRKDRPPAARPRAGGEALEVAGAYSLKDRDLRHARETVFNPGSGKTPPDAGQLPPEGGKAAPAAAPRPAAPPVAPVPPKAPKPAPEVVSPGRPRASSLPPGGPSSAPPRPASLESEFALDLGPLAGDDAGNSNTTLDRLSGFLETEPSRPPLGTEPAGHNAAPPELSFDDLELAFGDLEALGSPSEGSRSAVAGDPGTTLDIDAVMREESFTDPLPPWEPGPEVQATKEPEAPWRTDVVSGPFPASSAPVSPGPAPAPSETLAWGEGDFGGSLFDEPGAGPTLQVEIPAAPPPSVVPDSPGAQATQGGAQPKGQAETPRKAAPRRMAPGRTLPRLVRGGAVVGLLLVLVGVILGQTDYGYFGIKILRGPTGGGPGTQDGHRSGQAPQGPDDGSGPRYDRVSAYLDGIVRLERRVLESPNDGGLRTSLLEALATLRERYPSAFLKEPRFAAKWKDLAVQLNPQGALGMRLRVIERIAADQWDDAASLLEEARKEFPEDAALLCLSGRVATRRGRFEEAVRLFDQALARVPGFHAALHGKAVALLGSGKADAARTVFETILAAEPDHMEARLGLAEATLAMGDVEGAIRGGQEVLEKGRPGVDDEAIFQAHRLLARALSKQGDVAAANDQLRGALSLRPTDPEVAEDLALRLLQAGKASEALDVLRPAREAGKDGETFLLTYARVAFADDKGELAQAALLEGTEKHPRNPAFWVLRGTTSLEARKFQSAQAAFEAALKIDSGNVDAWVGLARTLFSQGKVQEAVARLKEAMEATRGHPVVLLTLAQFQEDQGEATEAENSLRMALSRDPGNVAVKQRLALLLMNQKRYEDAIPLFEEMDQKRQLDRAGILGYARALLAAHRVGQAETLLKKASEESPRDLDMAAEHAYALMESGNLPASETILRRNLAQTPNHPLTLYYLGQVLARRNAVDEAIQTLELAVRSNTRDPRPRIAVARLLLAYRGEEGRAAAKLHLDHVLGMYGRKEIPTDQQDPEAFMMHGRILFADQKYQAALRDFEAALALAPVRTDLLVDHARTLFEMSRHAQAKDFLRKVLSSSPNHPEANFLMARILLREGAVRQAREALERLVQRDPRSFPEAWRMLGMIYRDENQSGLARNAFQQYLRVVDDPRSAEAEEVQQLLGRMR